MTRDKWEASDLQYSETLQSMRTMYDQAVQQSKTDAVTYHNYQRYGILFNRHLSWEEK